MIRKICVFMVHIFSVIVFRVKTIGQENIPTDGAYIMCANHQSNWDAPILASSTKRKMHIMAKEEMFKTKFTRWFLEKCLVFPVKRGKMDLDSIKHSLKVLKEKQILMLFPEGTRKGMSKNGKSQNGAAFMTLRTGVPVIPVAIIGKMKPFHKVIIKYGKPMDFSQNKTNKPEKDLLDQVSKEIMDSIIMLTNEPK